MTATVSGLHRSWVGTHRMLLAVVAFAVALAATIAIVLVTSSSPSSTATPPTVPVEEELTDTQRACQLARVVGC